MGHEIAPGASYCPHGHPIALEAMPFANDQYGGGYGQQPGFGAPPAQPGGFGAPPAQPGFGGPYGQQGYPDPNAQWGQQPGGFGAPPAQPGGFGTDQGGYGQQPGGFAPQPGGFGTDQGGYGQQPGGFAPQPGGFGAPPAPPPGDFGPQPGGFGAPPQPGFGGAPGPGAGAAPAATPNLPPNALRGFLVSYQSNTTGDFWPLQGGRKIVGRANSGEQIDVPLSDATISSRHAAFVVDAIGGTVTLEDTGSTNGTFVNEEHIGFNGKRELRDGDKVRFGGFTTLVKIVGRI